MAQTVSAKLIKDGTVHLILDENCK